MLDKKDWNYILKRVISYILIAVLMFLFNIYKVNALVDTQGWNFDIQVSSSGYYAQHDFPGQPWYNYGEGIVYFTINYEGVSSSLPTDVKQLQEVYIITGNTKRFECFIGNNVTYNDSTEIHVQNAVQCPVDLTNNYISSVMVITRQVDTGQISTYHFSEFATFVSNGTDITSVANSVNDVNNTVNNVNNTVNNVNNTLNDSSGVSDNDVSGSTSDWSSLNSESGVINQLVLMPITLLNSFVNGINGTCSTYTLGELWGESLTLPCIDLSSMLGSLWSIIDVILSGVFIFVFGKQCVKIFNDFTNLRSGQIDTLYGGDN